MTEYRFSLPHEHLLLAFIHLLCVIVISIFASDMPRVNLYLALSTDRYGMDLHQITDNFPIIVLAICFSSLAFIDHMVCGVFAMDRYLSYVMVGRNPFRWIEYMISAPLMVVLISMLSGILELTILLSLFVLMSVTIHYGFLSEYMSKPYVDDGYFATMVLSCVPYLFMWLVLIGNFVYVASHQSPPWFVWAIEIVMFVLFASFAWVHHNQRTHPLSMYEKWERTFNRVSVVSKTTLVVLVVTGIKTL